MHEPTTPSPHQPPSRGRQVPLWVAVLMVFAAAGVTAVITIGFTTALEAARQDAIAEDTETFFRLKVDKHRHNELSASDIETVEIPRSQVNAFGTDAIRESDEIVGIPAGGLPRYFTIAAREGEILRESMFLLENRRLIGQDLSPGNRLFAIPVKTDNQPPGLAPEDRVDILANVIRSTGTVSVLVMERVPVRLVGDDRSPGSVSRGVTYDSVTIEIAQDQVQQLIDVQSRVEDNEFIIVVRNSNDYQTTLEEEGQVNYQLIELLGLNDAE